MSIQKSAVTNMAIAKMEVIMVQNTSVDVLSSASSGS